MLQIAERDLPQLNRLKGPAKIAVALSLAGCQIGADNTGNQITPDSSPIPISNTLIYESAPQTSQVNDNGLIFQVQEPAMQDQPIASTQDSDSIKLNHRERTIFMDNIPPEYKVPDESISKPKRHGKSTDHIFHKVVPSTSETVTSITQTSALPTLEVDLFRSGLYRFENPDTSACVAASQENMFNMIKANNSGGADFWWSLDTSYEKQEKLLAWDRDHDTAGNWENGTDVVGWVRGLKHHGLRYVIKRFSSYLSAMRDSARRIAITHEPVGILAETGHHAVVMTGFTSAGDPRITTDFTVTSINILDPMKGDNAVDRSFTPQGYNDFAYGMDPVNMRNNNSFDWPYDLVNNITTVQAINGYWVTVSPQY